METILLKVCGWHESKAQLFFAFVKPSHGLCPVCFERLRAELIAKKKTAVVPKEKKDNGGGPGAERNNAP